MPRLPLVLVLVLVFSALSPTLARADLGQFEQEATPGLVFGVVCMAFLFGAFWHGFRRLQS